MVFVAKKISLIMVHRRFEWVTPLADMGMQPSGSRVRETEVAGGGRMHPNIPLY